MSGKPRSHRPGRSRALRTIALVTLVLLVGVGGVVARGADLPMKRTEIPTGERGRYPADSLAIAELPGVPEDRPWIDTLAEVEALGIFTDDELAVYRAADVRRAKVGIASYEGGKATIVLVTTASPAAARRAVDRLDELQLAYGLARASAPRGVKAGVIEPAPEVVPGGRAHYAQRDTLVRVEYRAPDPAIAVAEFGVLLREQLKVLPRHD